LRRSFQGAFVTKRGYYAPFLSMPFISKSLLNADEQKNMMLYRGA